MDWSVLMKVPKIEGNSIPNVAAGLAYLYLDANTTYFLSPKSLQQVCVACCCVTCSSVAHLTIRSACIPLPQNQDAAANTLSQLYGQGTSSMGWLIYNDEGSSGPTCGYCGHTKGVLGFDANGAFWLIHSVPLYPPAVNGGGSYAYPDSGTE